MSISDIVTSIIRNIRVPITAGPNQGLRWSIAMGNRYRRGTFEAERVNAIASMIELGDCFWDIGAHRGYITSVAARRIGLNGDVYAFEPSPENLWYLNRHISWNRLQNARIVPAAISNFDGQARFGGGNVGGLTHKMGGGIQSLPFDLSTL